RARRAAGAARGATPPRESHPHRAPPAGGGAPARRRRGRPPADPAPGAPGADPRQVFDTVWATFADNYPFFAAKGIDWPALRERYRSRLDARTPAPELLAVLDDLLRPLGDAHTGVDAGAVGRIWHPRPGTLPVLDPAFRDAANRTTEAALGAPLTTFAAGRLAYADLPGGLGYLRITGFQHYTADGGYAEDAAELDRALDTILTPERTGGPHALRGLVLDLRLNGGGSDRLALRLAARLTDRPYLGYVKQARDDPRHADAWTRPQRVPVVPTTAPRFTGPVALLTSSATMSAAESLAMALMGRSPQPVRIGAATQGVFSDVLERALPNGWTFDLPNERYLTAQGRDFDGAGIPPTTEVPVYTEDELTSGRDSALAAARAALR
ncbi:S41 family peptidase, partial [Kitasatospora sp. NPDC059571]|uniref:S41 family peptidase n=1 Tax=Kitasatospora sp. NPDC059571 TaxID=3346871 RepID=UPI003689C906